jgi:alkylation response protein AidB-like acyl-CoA dehydrogenase
MSEASPRLTSSEPYPAPLPLPVDYQRHRPDVESLRSAIRACADGRPWARLTWIDLIEALLAVGRTDIPLARLVEGHVDALRILDQADRVPTEDALYGVWASRSRRTGVAAASDGSGWRLDGTLRFASGAGLLDRALVPVWLDDEHHLLIDLDVAHLPVDETAWVTSAMAVSRSHTVRLDGVRVSEVAAVGPIDFYLDRPAFFPGGVGVAACWAGGAARIADLLLDRSSQSWPEHVRARMGETRVQLVCAAAVVRSTARLLDELSPGSGSTAGADWQAISTEARAATANAVTAVLEQARRIGGAAGFAHDEDFSRAHHDLDLYVLQQNGDGDRAYLGGRYSS